MGDAKLRGGGDAVSLLHHAVGKTDDSIEASLALKQTKTSVSADKEINKKKEKRYVFKMVFKSTAKVSSCKPRSEETN